MNVRMFNSNLGTSSTGTTDKTTITSLNENGKILVQTENGIAVVHKNSEGYINAYGRVNGHSAYYSRIPIDSTTRALTQIGNTTGYNLVASMNSTKNYPVTVYNPQVAALSTVNYFNTLSYETYAASRMYGNQGNNNFPNIEYINEPVYNRNIAREAASWQGKGVCSGVGKWREIELKNGTKVIGGLPGQSEFYTTQRGFFRTNGIKTELWEGLQVKASPQFGYRPQVGVYKVISNSEAAFSITKANPQYGPGGLPQIYIPDYKTNLELMEVIDLK